MTRTMIYDTNIEIVKESFMNSNEPVKENWNVKGNLLKFNRHFFRLSNNLSTQFHVQKSVFGEKRISKSKNSFQLFEC